MVMVHKLSNIIYGYDFFISYTWSDGRPYARELYKQLTALDFICFLDDVNYKKGDDWSLVGAIALRHTGKLLLVGTPDIANSDPVFRELQVFKKTGREIIPIDIGRTFEKFPADSKIMEIIHPKILRIEETKYQKQKGPSDSTIQAIQKSFDLTKQNVKRIRYLRIAIVILLALLALATGLWKHADRQTKIANIERDNAERKTRQANASAYTVGSELTREEFPQLSGLFAAEAIKATKNDEVLSSAEQAVRTTLESISGFVFPADGAGTHVLNQNWLATNKGDGVVRIWDISIDPFHPVLEINEQGGPIAIGGTGRWMVTLTADGTAKLWDLESENLSQSVRVLSHDSGVIEDALFAADGQWLVTLSKKKTDKRVKTVLLWDLKKLNAHAVGNELLTESGKVWEGFHAQLELGPNGRWLVIQTYDKDGSFGDSSSNVELWDLWSNDPVSSGRKVWSGNYRDVVFAPSGRWLAITEIASSSVDINSYENEKEFRLYEDAQWINLLDLNSDTPFKIAHRLPHFTVDQGGRGWYLSLLFWEKGRWLASASDDGSIRLWDLQSENPSRSSFLLDAGAQNLMGSGVVGSVGVSDMAIDFNGRWFAAAKGRNVVLWNLKANEPRKSKQTLTEHEGAINAVSIDPTGRWLVAGADDQNVRVWDLHDLQIPNTARKLRGHEGSVYDVSFDPTGQWLITYGDYLRIHNLTGQNFTQEYPTIIHAENDMSMSPIIDPSGRWLITARHRYGQLWELGKASQPVLINEWPFVGSAEPFSTYGEDGSDWKFSLEENQLISQITHTIGLDEPVNTFIAISFWNLDNRLLERRYRLLEEYEFAGHKSSPDGRWLLEKTLEVREFSGLWDTQENKWFALEAEETSSESATAIFSPNSRWLVIVDPNDPIIRIWDLQSETPGKVRFRLQQYRENEDNNSLFIRFAFDRKGRWLVTSYDARKARIWDLEDEKPDRSYRTVRDLSDHVRDQTSLIHVGHDAQWVAVVGEKSKICRVWDLKNGDLQPSRHMLAKHSETAEMMGISPKGRWIVTDSADKTIRLWALDSKRSGDEVSLIHSVAGLVVSVKVDPTEHWLAAETEDGKVHLWDINSGKPSNTHQVVGDFGKSKIQDVAFDPSGKYLMINSPETICELRDLGSEDPFQIIRQFKCSEIADFLSIDTRGRWALVNLGDNQHALFNVYTDKLVEVDRDHHVIGDRNGGWLITSSFDSDGSGRIIHSTRENFLPNPITKIAPLTDVTLVENVKDEIAIGVGPKHRWLVTKNEQSSQQVSLWDLATKDPKASVIGSYDYDDHFFARAVIGPKGRWLVTNGGENTIRVWDLYGDHPTQTNATILRGHQGAVIALAIGPEDRWLISGSEDGTAILWDLTSNNIQNTAQILGGHAGKVEQVAISSQGHWAITKDEAGNVRLWDIKLKTLKGRLSKAIGRNMTEEEWKKYFPDRPYCPTFPELKAPVGVYVSPSCSSWN